MKVFRKIVLFVLTLTMIMSCFAAISTAADTSASLLSIYQDGMLFNQTKAAVIEGVANAGSVISLELKNKNNKTVLTSTAVTASDGVFFISFTAPAGSFDEYSIVLYENDVKFRTLNNILFGELWLASGQSNMQYPLIQSPEGAKAYAENKKLSYWLRVLLVPPYPEYKGSTSLVPCEPQNDLTDAIWVNGENIAVYNMSAVAYFFAEELAEEIGMPVGILNSSLGGSSIRSWLSREAIDNTPEVKQYLYDNGEYIEKAAWDEANRNVYQDMCANYNQKIAPITNFDISGMIWYQGETDLMMNNTQYDKQFTLMQETFTQDFNYKNGLLPIIYTQIASYYYSEDGMILSDWNKAYCDIQKSHSDSRAMITMYDIPLTYLPEAGLIHPESKSEVGERMAYSAVGLVYGYSDTYTAATVKSYTIEDNCVYITFDNTGDGLICSGKDLNGFAICSDNGIYVDAKAEITAPDTVKVYSDGIDNPVSVSYAYCVANQNANLYATKNAELALPVAPFITENTNIQHYWFEKPWTDADSDKIWYTEDDSLSGYYDMWNGKKAEVTSTQTAAFSGVGGLNIKATSKQFSVSPTLTYKDGLKEISFRNADTDYSYYGTMSFYVKNTSSECVKLENIKFLKNTAVWYAPAIADTLDCATEIPADNQWHKITVDLNRVYHLGNECSLSYGNNTLKDIKNIEFCFSTESNDAVIYLDDISFSPETEIIGTRYDVDIKNADNIIEVFTAIFLTIFGKFVSLFGC